MPVQRGAVEEPAGCITRYELKYFVPDGCYESLKKDLLQFLEYDEHATDFGERHYTVRSIYFDTPNLRFYYEKVHGNNCRSKVRIRRYETSGLAPSDWFLETKSKYHNACVKPQRLEFHDTVVADHLLRYGSIRLNELIDRISPGRQVSNLPGIWALPLGPKILVVYDRVPLVDPRQSRFRLTFDSNIRARFTGNLYEKLGPADRLTLPLLMEVKFERTVPVWLDALLRKYGLRAASISKYCQAVEAAFPIHGAARTSAFPSGGIALSALGFLKNSYGFSTPAQAAALTQS